MIFEEKSGEGISEITLNKLSGIRLINHTGQREGMRKYGNESVGTQAANSTVSSCLKINTLFVCLSTGAKERLNVLSY